MSNQQNNLTLGSLFDGSGGFTFGGLLCGITPLWASEVEPFPIRVTTKRMPQIAHYGDINKISGSAVPPVDIITGGFCCQDLSVAGKRAGLHGERSGLFFQIIRIIREMRAATNNEYPKYAVLENVPGMYSSRKGLDFQKVLNELIKISELSNAAKSETQPVPLPKGGKWSTSGEIVGDSHSLAWRTFDAQFWGVAQHRRRCYIVVDFTGERAGKILFDETRLRGNPPPCGFSWENTAGNSANCVGDAVTIGAELGAASRVGGHVWDNYVGALKAHAGDNQTVACYPINTQVALREDRADGTGLGVAENGEPAYTLQAHHSHAIAVHNHPSDSRVTLDESGLVQCLTSKMGMGGGNCPMVLNERQYAMTVGENVANTMDASQYKGTQVVVSLEGNGSRPSHKGSGISESGTAYTLNAVERHAVAYQDRVGALTTELSKQIGNQGPLSGQLIVESERTVVENHQHSGYREVETAGTLKSHGGTNGGGSENMVIESRYVVRRLTPTECALLQGFPPDWCSGLGTAEPSDDDIAFWADVWETHRKIEGKSTKPKTRNQLVKWLKNPHSDSAEYKMWGNGCCLNNILFVLNGIVEHSQSIY